MRIISSDQIERTHDYLETLSDKDQKKFMRKFQKKQEPLMVYVAALLAREEMNDAEQDFFVSTVFFLWKVTLDASENQKMILIVDIEKADDRVRDLMQKAAQFDEDQLVELGIQEAVNLFEQNQPELIDYVMTTIVELDEDSGVREEMKGILITYLNMILELLIQAGS